MTPSISDPQHSAVTTNRTKSESQAAMKIRRWAQVSPLSIQTATWIMISFSSIVAGSILYFLLVFSAYSDVEVKLLTTPPTEVNYLSVSAGTKNGVCQLPQGAAKLYAAAFGITNENTLGKLQLALCARQPVLASRIPALAVVEAFISQNWKCGGESCSAECARYWQDRIARLLGGSFLTAESNLEMVPQPPTRPVQQAGAPAPSVAVGNEARADCAIAEPLRLREKFWGILRKPEPVSAPEVAKWLLGLEPCVGEQRDDCALVTRILQSSLDSDKVRSARTWVNMICGAERLAVLILFFVMLQALIYRSIVRRNLDQQKEKTLDWLGKDGKLSAKEAGAWFEETFPAADDNTEFTPIRNLLKAAEKSLDEIDLRARIDAELIKQSRVVVDTLITIFPVIGFVATLWGLIVALSSANLIASSTGDERNANVMRVTSELSSCFSTTLLALICMTLFAVWATIQAKRESALVSDIQECCLKAFRAGTRGRANGP